MTQADSRAARRILAAGVVTALSLSAIVASTRALAGYRGPAWMVLVPLVLAPAAAIAGRSARVRAAAFGAMDVAATCVALAVAFAAAFSAVVLVAGHLPDDREQGFVVQASGLAVLCALFFGPTRSRARLVVTRAVHAERETVTDVLETFGRAGRAVPEDELLRQLAESLRISLRLSSVELWVGPGARQVLACRVPHSPRDDLTIGPAEERVLSSGGAFGRAWLDLWMPVLLAGGGPREVRLAPAVHGGLVLGLVVVERAVGDPTFTDVEDRTLADLGRRLGVVLHNLRLDSALQATLADLQSANRELAASRGRLVAAADAERRRLERDLHDGAQQHLVAIAVELGTAEVLIAKDPGAAVDLVARLRTDVRVAIDALRDLAHGIYPPLLMEAGPALALRAVARTAAIPITVESTIEGRVPPDIEAAVYFSCLEAVQNASKHAPGAAVAIRLTGGPDGLAFEVTDSGPGFDIGKATRGSGMENIEDRIGAVGGRVHWRRNPSGGTTVYGTVPVAVPS